MNTISSEVVAMSAPFLGEVPLHFDRPMLALGGVAVAAATVAVGMRRGRQLEEQADAEVSLYPDPDMAEAAVTQYSRERRVSKVTGALLGLAAGAALVNASGPSTIESNYNANRVSIIVEAGVNSRAKDVTDTEKDEEVTRMAAGLNSGLRFSDELGQDVEVQFIFSGSPARSLGEVKGAAGSDDVVAKAEAYTRDLSTAAETPDISGALAVADAFEADQTIVITSDESVTTADALNAYARPLSVVSPGTTGTEFRMLGNDRTAGYTAQFGDIKAKSVQDTDQMEKAMDTIIDSKIKNTKEVPSKFFENLRNISGIALGVGLGVMKLTPLRKRRVAKGV